MEPEGSTVSHWPSLCAPAEQGPCTVSSLMEPNAGFIKVNVLLDLMLFKNTKLQLT